MHEEFIGEPLAPVPGTADSEAMAIGEPGLPHRFVWRDREYTVGEVIETWKDTAPCAFGGQERYRSKHWFRIKTVCGQEMKIYFDRRRGSGSSRTQRWWVYTVCEEDHA